MAIEVGLALIIMVLWGIRVLVGHFSAPQPIVTSNTSKEL